jgi:hypothetical protein
MEIAVEAEFEKQDRVWEQNATKSVTLTKGFCMEEPVHHLTKQTRAVTIYGSDPFNLTHAIGGKKITASPDNSFAFRRDVHGARIDEYDIWSGVYYLYHRCQPGMVPHIVVTDPGKIVDVPSMLEAGSPVVY